MKQFLFSFQIIWLVVGNVYAQKLSQDGQLKFLFNEDGSHYIRLTGSAQVWLRNTQMNPGTTIAGYDTDQYNDISIRRLRFQLYGQLSDRIFFYTQFGQNNFNFHSPKYTGAFFHDAVLEYAIDRNKLSFGAGLTGWSGLTRYASPSIGSLLSLDAPLYQQTTNGVNEQFIRKLSVYAKGQLGRLDYRLALTSPMTLTNATTPVNGTFSFSNEPPKMQAQGYFRYMLLDKEANTTPYMTGSYLGKKNVFTLGTGIIYQPEAMWSSNPDGETIHEALVLYGVDVFYDRPLSAHSAITAYAAFTNYDFGTGYIRHIGVNNPATGSPGPGGHGNAFPMVGTGNTWYAQAGYLFGDDLLTDHGKLQPFMAMQYSAYDYLADPMFMYELGINYLVHGTHDGKLSLMYQSRPTYEAANGNIVANGRKGMSVIQYQVSF